MIHRGVGRAAAAVAVVAAAALMSGCALIASPARSTPGPTTTRDAVPLSQQLPDVLVAGQAIGTGRLAVIDHEPIDAARAAHPLTGTVRVVVTSDRQVEFRIRPDDPATANLKDIDLVASGTRYDGRPENIQDVPRFSLVSDLDRVDADGELVLPLAPDFPAAGDPSFLHSVEESLAGDTRVFVAATITWTLRSPYPGLQAVDSGIATFAHGEAIAKDGLVVSYIPNPYDTIYAVSRRFGLTEVQLLWLNPWMLDTNPELKDRVGINLDPARR